MGRIIGIFMHALGMATSYEGDVIVTILSCHGADVNCQDPKGMTALHYMLKKGSDKKFFEMLIAHGARGDIKNNDGVMAAELMRKKKDPQFRRMADQLRTGA